MSRPATCGVVALGVWLGTPSIVPVVARPETRAVMGPDEGEVIAIPQVGGLHHRYERRQPRRPDGVARMEGERSENRLRGRGRARGD